MKTSAKELTFAVAVRRLDLARLGAALRELEAVKIAELRVEVADGTFTPDFALGYDVIETVVHESKLPVHVHLVAERPDRFLDDFARLGCAAVTVPIEACLHAHRTVTRIREQGMQAGLSIQPGTALTKLEYVLPMVDHLALPARDAVNTNASIAAAAYDRVRILRENLDYHQSRAWLHAGGELTPAESARFAAIGATRILIDRKDVLHTEPLGTSVRGFMDAVAKGRKTA